MNRFLRKLNSRFSFQRLIPLSVSLMLSGTAMASVAEIVSLSGNTDYRLPAEEKWQPAKLNQKMDNGQYLRTGANSSMALLLEDKTQLRLAPHSIFQFKESDPNSGGTKLNLRQGRAWAQTKSLPGTLRVETPSAVVSIHGTDWEMEVDEEGRTRLVVLHGVVELYNEHGSVTVRNNESALAEKGKAPVKYLLQNPAERVQWVTAYRVDPSRYAELNESAFMREIAALLRVQRLAEARQRLIGAEWSSPAVPLLLADFAIYGGDLRQAEEILTQGERHFPTDTRLAAQRIRVALYRGDSAMARQCLAESLARYPDDLELRLVKGELARLDGAARKARAAYRAAVTQAPGNARGWLGLGVVESETENVGPARELLETAMQLDAQTTGARGELATLETFADRLDVAQTHYEQALHEQPDDYVALTGLGLLQLKRGEPEEALRTLLRANVIEPKYARAVIYTAIAYYQLGRQATALETLARVAEIDPHDPMPHFLAAQIHQDHWQAGDAVRAARRGIERLPYLKSLNQLANDMQGSANLGAAYALFGLEASAQRAAHDSYDPFWAGSHFFLGRHYEGEFSRNAELTLGFLTDPTAFGMARPFQPLLASPGASLRGQYWLERGNGSRVDVPIMTANGYRNDGMPFALFAEAQRPQWRQTGLRADASQGTLGLGLKPNDALRLFLFANRFEPDVTQSSSDGILRARGLNERIDLGASWRHGPDRQTWFKLDHTGEDSRIDSPSTVGILPARELKNLRPARDDGQFRHTMRLDSGDTLSGGVEHARLRADYDATRSPNNGTRPITITERSLDRSALIWADWQTEPHGPWQFDTQLTHTRLASDMARVTRLSFGTVPANEKADQARWQWRLGGIFRPTADWTLRAAWQDWTRPYSFNTLVPVATAGIPVDDRYTLPGGRLQRIKLQSDWQSDHSLTQAWVDHRRIDNPVFECVDGAVYHGSELADLSRLDVRALQNLALDEPVGQPIFVRGRLDEAGIGHEQILSDNFSFGVRLRHTQSRSTLCHHGIALPYTPRQQLGIGATWLPGPRWLVQARAVWSSGQFSDVKHTDTSEIPAGWEHTLRGSWQSVRKDWQIGAYLRKQVGAGGTVGGMAVQWRY